MRRRKWTKELIVEEFLKYKLTGKPLQAKKFRTDNGALYGAILYHYKSYKSFIESLGIDYNELADKRRWTNAEVVEEFRKYEARGYELNAKTMYNHNVALYAQILERFGTYEAFLKLQGLDYNEITKKRQWTEQDVVQALQDRIKNNESLVSSIISDDHFALYRACTTVFGSYRSAIEAAGFNYVDCVNDFGECSYYGREFENKLAEMFEALNYTYTKHYRYFDGCIPDFYDETENVIYDAKLSSWTVFNSKTIEKYMPHCDKLVIIYLRGATIKQRINGLELRHVSYYYDELRDKGLTQYIDEFEEMLTKINATSTQAEAS